MSKRIAVLGSTGSIGAQTLDVARELAGDIEVVALSAHANCELLFEQAREFRARHIAVGDPNSASGVDLPPDSVLHAGVEGLCEIATLPEVDLVVFAIFGAVGLKPLVAAIDAGKDIAFASKEALVAGGSLIVDLARERGINFLPIDSEHNSVWRCLVGRNARTVRKVILTASGGPFRGFTREMLRDVTLDNTLRHPVWTMGKRITVNSATMMNKALELVEARFLFDLGGDKLDILVHPQGIVHAMVEMYDGTHIAHLGRADMKLPIRYCLKYPVCSISDVEAIDLTTLSGLTFERADETTFSAIPLGRTALTADWTYAVALNATNEVLVDRFLAGGFPFIALIENIERAAESFHRYAGRPHTIDDVIALDAEVRERTREGDLRYIS